MSRDAATPSGWTDSWKSEYPIFTDIEVRFRDTDAMGHVNNAVYVTYLEVGRQEYWKRITTPGGYAKVPFVVGHVSISFRSAAQIGETVRVGLRVVWISRSSFGMDYELRDLATGRLLAEAETTLVTFDYEADRSMPVPQELREAFERIEGRPLAR